MVVLLNYDGCDTFALAGIYKSDTKRMYPLSRVPTYTTAIIVLRLWLIVANKFGTAPSNRRIPAFEGDAATITAACRVYLPTEISGLHYFLWYFHSTSVYKGEDTSKLKYQPNLVRREISQQKKSNNIRK